MHLTIVPKSFRHIPALLCLAGPLALARDILPEVEELFRGDVLADTFLEVLIADFSIQVTVHEIEDFHELFSIHGEAPMVEVVLQLCLLDVTTLPSVQVSEGSLDRLPLEHKLLEDSLHQVLIDHLVSYELD